MKEFSFYQQREKSFGTGNKPVLNQETVDQRIHTNAEQNQSVNQNVKAASIAGTGEVNDTVSRLHRFDSPQEILSGQLSTEIRPRQQLLVVGQNQNPFVSDVKNSNNDKANQIKKTGEKSSHTNTQETNNFGAYLGMQGTGGQSTPSMSGEQSSAMMPTPQLKTGALPKEVSNSTPSQSNNNGNNSNNHNNIIVNHVHIHTSSTSVPASEMLQAQQFQNNNFNVIRQAAPLIYGNNAAAPVGTVSAGSQDTPHTGLPN